MVGALLSLLLCQLAGEIVARALALPLPGPVVGALILLVLLGLRRRIPDALARTSHGLLVHLSLLFVPAGAGIIVHAARIKSEILALSVALIVSTGLSIAVAALVFVWTDRLLNREPKAPS